MGFPFLMSKSSDGLTLVDLPGKGRAYVRPDGDLMYSQGDGRTCSWCRVNNTTHAVRCKACGSAL